MFMRKGIFQLRNSEHLAMEKKKDYEGQILEGIFTLEKNESDGRWISLLKDGYLIVESGERLEGEFYDHRWVLLDCEKDGTRNGLGDEKEEEEDSFSRVSQFKCKGRMIGGGKEGIKRGVWLCEDTGRNYRLVKKLC